MDRQLSNKTPTIHKIIQTDNQVTIEYSGLEKVGLKKRETYDLEGMEQVKEFDPLAGKGLYRTQTSWSDDGSQLIIRTYLSSSAFNTKCTLVCTRFLENPTTLTQVLQLVISNEFAPSIQPVKRIFKKKA